MKILIIDDHVLFREGLAAILQMEPGIEVAGMAGTVHEAVEIARTVGPDIILMDFSLTDGTGVEATQAILAVQPDTKIIFLSMSGEDERLLAAIRAGAKGYLLKDIRPVKLVEALRAVEHGEGALSGSMTLRLMNEVNRARPSERPYSPLLDKLTQRELEVLRYIAAGKTNQEIAGRLVISENTVKYHVHSILEKLNLTNRKEAARYASEHGLV